MKNRMKLSVVVYAVVMLLLLSWMLGVFQPKSDNLAYSQIVELFQQQQVKSFQVNDHTITLYLYEPYDGKTTLRSQLADPEGFQRDFQQLFLEQQEAGILEAYDFVAGKEMSPYDFVLPIVLAGGVLLILWMVLASRASRSNPMSDFGKARTTLGGSQKKVTFKDVAGVDEEKAELQEVVDFLRNPKKFEEMGARIPHGILLAGAPGTGKTLLAKAVAGESNAAFLAISGSDFMEMYVGVGASRVRDLFQQARKVAPAIIFIDEIDAVGRKRGTGLGGGHDEREQTLNQMLVEMDGFADNEGIIVMAATNRVDILDPAIMRPGRFDRKVTVGRPDVKAREEILQLHARNKRLSEDVDLARLAQTTSGFTGADLENLLNEAAIAAAVAGRDAITQGDVEFAFIKLGIGTEKRSKVISERDKRITAYHETGHAILDSFVTKKQLKHMMMAAMGGRIAEELVCDDITTGASQDIRQVTKIARAMVMQYGMSEKVGMINYDENGDDVFLGYDIAHSRSYGDEMLSTIDKEIKRLVDECYAAAKEMILAHKDVLEKSCQLLLEKEKISGEEFEALFG